MVLMGAEGKNTRLADVNRITRWLKKEWDSFAIADNVPLIKTPDGKVRATMHKYVSHAIFQDDEESN